MLCNDEHRMKMGYDGMNAGFGDPVIQMNHVQTCKRSSWMKWEKMKPLTYQFWGLAGAQATNFCNLCSFVTSLLKQFGLAELKRWIRFDASAEKNVWYGHGTERHIRPNFDKTEWQWFRQLPAGSRHGRSGWKCNLPAASLVTTFDVKVKSRPPRNRYAKPKWIG